jgi:hypothetical protein
MKTERRHELQHNSLDTELVKGIDYLKKNAKGISLAILTVIAAITLGYVVIRNQSAKVSVPRQKFDQIKRLDTSTANGRSTALTGFKELASQTGNDRVAAMACVEVGDMCVRQQVSGDFVSGALETAQASYQRVIDEFSDNSDALGRAYLGLARLAEGKSNFATAREHYRNILELGDKASLLVKNAATMALDTLSDIEKPVRLATSRPAPVITRSLIPTSQPTSQPASQPAPAVAP